MILSILLQGDLLSIKIPKVQPLILRIAETIRHNTAFLLLEMENNIYEYIRMIDQDRYTLLTLSFWETICKTKLSNLLHIPPM